MFPKKRLVKNFAVKERMILKVPHDCLFSPTHEIYTPICVNLFQSFHTDQDLRSARNFREHLTTIKGENRDERN